MAKVPFKKFNSADVDLMRLQDNVDRALNGVQMVPINSGQFTEKLALVVGDNTIEHKLGRKVTGYSVASQNAASAFYDNLQTGTDLGLNFTLNSSAVCTVILWVY